MELACRFSIVAAPTSSAQLFRFLSIFANVCYFLFLIWTSLIISDVERVFMRASGHLCVFFGEMSVCPFLNQFVVFVVEL